MRTVQLNELISGDIILYKNGRSILSKTVIYFTKKYSHAIAYVGTKSDVLNSLNEYLKESEHKEYSERIQNEIQHIESFKCEHVFIESDFSLSKYIKSLFSGIYIDGVKLVTFDEISGRTGDHDVYRSSLHGSIKDKFIQSSIYYALMDIRYDFAGLIWQAVTAFRKRVGNRNTNISIHNTSKMYCSELTRTLETRSGIIFDTYIPPENTTPYGESERADMMYIGELSKKCS